MRIRKRPRTSGTNFMHYNSDIGTAFPSDASNPSGVESPAEKDAPVRYRQQMSTVIPNFQVRKRSEVQENGSPPDLENRILKIEGRLSRGSKLQHPKEGWTLEVDHGTLRVPTDSLLVSLCRVLSVAGGSGLTAREAASKIKEKGFVDAGLNEASSMPSSVKIAKLLRNNPQFTQTTGGKFIMTARIRSCNSLQEKTIGTVNDEKSHIIEQQQKVNQVMTGHRYEGSLVGSVGKNLKQPMSSIDEIDIKGEQSNRKINCWGKLSGSRLPSSSHACLHQIQNSCFKSEHKTTGIYSPQVISSVDEPHCGGDTPQGQLGARNGHPHSESNPRRRKRVKARCLMSIMRTSM